jgi:heme/copper-type cytochrome/quinol oxidase subunit 2
MRYISMATKKKTILICVLIFVGITLAVLLFNLQYREIHAKNEYCHLNLTRSAVTIMISKIIILKIIPVFIFTILNCLIAVKSIRTDRQQETAMRSVGNSSDTDRTHIQGHRDLIRFCLLVSLTYTILYLPSVVEFTIYVLQIHGIYYYNNYRVSYLVQNYTGTIYAFAFASNFFLYMLGSSVFRNQLQTLVRCGSSQEVENSRTYAGVHDMQMTRASVLDTHL